MSKLNYLIIENAPDVCEGIQERMEPFKNWKPLPFSISPGDAIGKIENNKPGLIFLDWSLSSGSAYEVLEHIIAIPNYEPYIVFNTGYQKDNPEIPQIIFNNYRIDKYIIKPIWENLRKNLAQYVCEAEARANSYRADAKNAWLQDERGNKILVDLGKIICICQSATNKRLRILFLNNHIGELAVPLQWVQIYELLDQYYIDYFITKNRAYLVTRNYIASFEKPYIRFVNFSRFKVEVVRDNIKAFENWLVKDANLLVQ